MRLYQGDQKKKKKKEEEEEEEKKVEEEEEEEEEEELEKKKKKSQLSLPKLLAVEAPDRKSLTFSVPAKALGELSFQEVWKRGSCI